MSRRGRNHAPPVRACAVCGCTDVTPCVTDEGPCRWIEPDLCSACVTTDVAYELRAGGYHELAERVIAAGLDSLPRVIVATEGELNALLRARKAGA